jgi:hypothetical protein
VPQLSVLGKLERISQGFHLGVRSMVSNVSKVENYADDGDLRRSTARLSHGARAARSSSRKRLKPEPPDLLPMCSKGVRQKLACLFGTTLNPHGSLALFLEVTLEPIPERSVLSAARPYSLKRRVLGARGFLDH